MIISPNESAPVTPAVEMAYKVIFPLLSATGRYVQISSLHISALIIMK